MAPRAQSYGASDEGAQLILIPCLIIFTASWLASISSCVSSRTVLRAAASSSSSSSSSFNWLENGSFEDGVFSAAAGGNDEILGVPNRDIRGWMVTNGTIDYTDGKWKRASDCSPRCIDLSGGDVGTIATNFSLPAPSSSNNANYTLLLDFAANPDAPSPVKGSFSISLFYYNNNDTRLGVNSSRTLLNSTLVFVDGTGYSLSNIGWHTASLFFSTPANLAAPSHNLTLSLSSNIHGWYGPLIDNVRIYQGPVSIDPERDVTCLDDLPPEETHTHTTLILAIVIPLACLMCLLCLVLLVWRKTHPKDDIDEEVLSKLGGRIVIYPFRVLKNATQNFKPEWKLGQGTFGVVFKGVLEDGAELAIKQLFSTTHQGRDEFLNEVICISSVQHRNLVSLKGCCTRGADRFLVYEYLENTSLHQVLWGSSTSVHLSWQMRLKIVRGMAQGLAYLHEASQPRIIHRDIKASNILLDKDFEAKIGDFGLAKLFPDDQTHLSTRIAGTLGYLAPEYALKGQLTQKADVFSFGIVVLELISGRKNLMHELCTEEQYLLDWVRMFSILSISRTIKKIVNVMGMSVVGSRELMIETLQSNHVFIMTFSIYVRKSYSFDILISKPLINVIISESNTFDFGLQTRKLHHETRTEEIIDPIIRSDEGYSENEAQRLVVLGLSCTKMDPSMRPTMGEVCIFLQANGSYSSESFERNICASQEEEIHLLANSFHLSQPKIVEGTSSFSISTSSLTNMSFEHSS